MYGVFVSPTPDQGGDLHGGNGREGLKGQMGIRTSGPVSEGAWGSVRNSGFRGRVRGGVWGKGVPVSRESDDR